MKTLRPSSSADIGRVRGFTLLELIVVISIVAILSISAAAVFNRQAFDTARFARELDAVLAFAQKSAVAQRRAVNVSVAAGAVSFGICSGFDPCGATTALPVPTQAGGASLPVPAGVTLSATVGGAAQALPFAFSFTPLGGMSGLAGPLEVTATGDISKSVRVERDTGYVHALP